MWDSFKQNLKNRYTIFKEKFNHMFFGGKVNITKPIILDEKETSQLEYLHHVRGILYTVNLIIESEKFIHPVLRNNLTTTLINFKIQIDKDVPKLFQGVYANFRNTIKKSLDLTLLRLDKFNTKQEDLQVVKENETHVLDKVFHENDELKRQLQLKHDEVVHANQIAEELRQNITELTTQLQETARLNSILLRQEPSVSNIDASSGTEDQKYRLLEEEFFKLKNTNDTNNLRITQLLNDVQAQKNLLEKSKELLATSQQLLEEKETLIHTQEQQLKMLAQKNEHMEILFQNPTPNDSLLKTINLQQYALINLKTAVENYQEDLHKIYDEKTKILEQCITNLKLQKTHYKEAVPIENTYKSSIFYFEQLNPQRLPAQDLEHYLNAEKQYHKHNLKGNELAHEYDKLQQRLQALNFEEQFQQLSQKFHQYLTTESSTLKEAWNVLKKNKVLSEPLEDEKLKALANNSTKANASNAIIPPHRSSVMPNNLISHNPTLFSYTPNPAARAFQSINHIFKFPNNDS